MSLKVLHIFDHTQPLFSGYVFRSRAIYLNQRELGITPLIVSSVKQGERPALLEYYDQVPHYRTAQTGYLAAGPAFVRECGQIRLLQRRIEGVAKETGAQVLHAHSPQLNGWAAYRAARRLGLPVVYEVRAFWEDAAVDHGSFAEDSLRYRLSRALETALFKRADQVIAICEGLRRDIVARGIATDKVSVVPNGVHLQEFLPQARDAALSAKLGLDGMQVLGFIGSFYHYEGLDDLLAAMPALHTALPRLRLLLVGGGPMEAALKAQVQRLGLDDVVIFTGRVAHAEVNAYASLVDLFVFPRKSMRLTELVTPLKPLESMAMAKPVLASDVGGHQELIRDGDTGLLFRAGDADALQAKIQAFFADADLAQRVTAAGHAWVQRERGWATLIQRHREIYRRLGLPG